MALQPRSSKKFQTSKSLPISSIFHILATVTVPPDEDILFGGVSFADSRKIYGKLQQLQQENGFPTSCEYYSRERLFVVKAMPSPVHECVQDWFLYVLSKMQHDGFVPWRDWFDRISRNAGMGESPLIR